MVNVRHIQYAYPMVPLQQHYFSQPLRIKRLNAHTYQATSDLVNNKNVVCYFANWAADRKGDGKYVPENVEGKLCTHIFYSYGGLDSLTLKLEHGDPIVDIKDGKAFSAGFISTGVFRRIFNFFYSGYRVLWTHHGCQAKQSQPENHPGLGRLDRVHRGQVLQDGQRCQQQEGVRGGRGRVLDSAGF